MSTFKEFLNQREQIDEGLRSNLAMGAAALGSMLGLGGNVGAQAPTSSYASHVTVDKEMPAREVSRALLDTSNPREVAKSLGKYNINKISDADVNYLISKPMTKDILRSILTQYGGIGSNSPNSFDNLKDHDVYNLLINAGNPQHMASVLGADNIKKLNDIDVSNLLKSSKRQEYKSALQKYGRIDSDGGPSIVKNNQESGSGMAKAPANLDGHEVFMRIFHARDPEKMAEFLGKDNIRKISDYDVQKMLSDRTMKAIFGSILEKYGRIDTQYKDKSINNLDIMDGHGAALKIFYSRDPEKTAMGIPKEIIRKIPDGDVSYMLRDQKRGELFRSILEKYGRISAEAGMN